MSDAVVYKDETRERDNGETYPIRINSGISIQFSGYLQIHNFNKGLIIHLFTLCHMCSRELFFVFLKDARKGYIQTKKKSSRVYNNAKHLI